MYEGFYLLRNRPFGVDACAGGCWLTPETERSVQHAVACLENGAEVALVSGPVGSGKSTISRELARRLSDQLRPVILPHSEFDGSSELWRSILFELGSDAPGLRDDDARLALLRAARNVRPDRNGLLIVADDAEVMSDGLLEDLRRLTVQRHEGRPIVQLILCGTYELEERLTRPELHSFSRRIGQQILLEPLSREQARLYLLHRVSAAGGTAASLFDDAALEAICAAADGNLHCLNQLADHSLLLGFTSEERPVTGATVAAALDDLKGLPLPWNIPLTADGPETLPAEETELRSVDAEIAETATEEDAGDRTSWWDTAGDAAAIEVGADRTSAQDLTNLNEVTAMSGPPDDAVPDESPMPALEPEGMDLDVVDPYAALDRMAEQGRTAPMVPVAPAVQSAAHVEEVQTQKREERLRTHTGGMETKLLLDVTALRNELKGHAAGITAEESAPLFTVPREMAPTEADWDIVEPELDDAVGEPWCEPTVCDLDVKFARTEPMLSIGGEAPVATDRSSDGRSDTSNPRRYARMFTQLQERRASVKKDIMAWPLRLWR